MQALAQRVANPMQKTSGSYFLVRCAEEKDLPAMIKIYNYYIFNEIANHQEELETLEHCIPWLREQDEKGWPVLVILESDERTRQEKVIGFACLSEMSARSGRTAAEASIYLTHDRHGTGASRILTNCLLEAARASGIHSIIFHVNSDNHASINLAKTLGFRVVGELKDFGFAFGKWIDVTILQKILY